MSDGVRRTKDEEVFIPLSVCPPIFPPKMCALCGRSIVGGEANARPAAARIGAGDEYDAAFLKG